MVATAPMPFDLFVSRAPTYHAMRGEPAPKNGFFARLFSSAPPPPTGPIPPITRDEFHEALSQVPATLASRDAYRVIAADGTPWFVAQWQPAGYVLLSTSYSYARYVRNFANMFDWGLQLASHLEARLFDEVHRAEITPENIDALLAQSGKYVALQVETHRRVATELEAEARAPLEYPLGPIDMVSEYLIFHVEPERTLSAAEVPARIESALPELEVEVASEDAWYVKAGEQLLTKMLRRPDGHWQVWPSWGSAPFTRIGETTLAVAELLGRETGGTVQFLGRPLDAPMQEALRAHLGGLGVDFYVWTRELTGSPTT